MNTPSQLKDRLFVRYGIRMSPTLSVIIDITWSSPSVLSMLEKLSA